MLKSILFFVVSLFFNVSFCQYDFDKFTKLESSGDLPSDFTTLSSEKVELDQKEGKDKDLDEDFYLDTRFVIDELLHSGKVLYNDPIGNYVNRVAKIVLRSEKGLYKELRFYVLKSNNVNAFSTDQGIIFITTGLISQIETEAQLAFIIAHEVTHYKEHHVKDRYLEKQIAQNRRGSYRKLSYNDLISSISNYDKDQELEADKGGIELYLKTSYAVDEIYGGFQALLYGYLPFDDKIFDTTYFNTENLIIPGSFFPDTINEITRESDYDDELSTHPNIKKRIDLSFEIIGDRESRGSESFIVGKDKFDDVRNLSRFQAVILSLSERNYVNALYQIYLLDQNFSDNEFLELARIKALYGLAKYKNNNRFNEVTRPLKYVEGESYKLHYLFKGLTRPQLNVIAFRHIYDASLKYSTSPIFKEYYTDFRKDFATESNLKMVDLKAERYEEYLKTISETLEEFSIEDSIRKIDNSDLSKFKKIQAKKKLRNLNDEGELGTGEFHLFALNDLVAKEGFIDDLKGIKNEEEKSEELVKSKEKKSLGIKKVTVVDPIFSHFNLKSKKNRTRSEDKELGLINLYKEKYSKLNIDVEVLSGLNFVSKDAEKLNDMAVIKDWMAERMEHDDIKMISSVHDLMEPINEARGSANYLFSGVFGSKSRNEFTGMHLYGILFLYTAPIAIADLLVVHNYFEYIAIEMNSETEEIEYVKTYDVNLKAINTVLKAYVYDVLHELSKEPKE